MQKSDVAKKIHETYLQCKETFAPNKILLNDTIKIEDEEERLFFRTVSDFFLQQKQKEIINEEKYGEK